MTRSSSQQQTELRVTREQTNQVGTIVNVLQTGLQKRVLKATDEARPWVRGWKPYWSTPLFLAVLPSLQLPEWF